MNNQNILWAEFIKAVKHEVVPALGCTEPISLALASAIAAAYLEGPIDKIEAKVSPNLMKNGMAVTVPGTGMVGLPIAAAVGALGGDPNGGLEVLKPLTKEIVKQGKHMLEQNQVSVTIAGVPKILYAESKVFSGNHWVKVCIADTHTQVTLIETDAKIIFKAASDSAIPTHIPLTKKQTTTDYSLASATARNIFEFVQNVPFESIQFILEAAALNEALSQEGLKNEYGLHIGATLQRQIAQGFLADDLLTKILIRSTAASDARMGGATLPAMSNSGSGNQGIAATMPVVVVADFLNANQEQRARALILAHLIAIYVHNKLPRLSALCAVTTASMGAAAGMAWLLSKGEYEPISMAICSMVGDIAGIICDGASNSCAMKVSTSASSAFKAVLMALDSMRVTGNEGIVCHDVDESIDNLCALACGSMQQTDIQILDLMISKNEDCL